MAVVFNLKHAFYSAAGAAVGAIAGYLFGIILYIVMLASGAFVATGTTLYGAITAFSTSAGVFPMLFATGMAAIGFFGGYYMSVQADEAKAAVAGKVD